MTSAVSIGSAEQALFSEWRQVEPLLVADGVVVEADYLASSPRLLFILKEAAGLSGGGWDLSGYLANGAAGDPWDSIARWAKAIRRLPEEIAWDVLEENLPEIRHAELRAIAVVNLKKRPGGLATDRFLLTSSAARDEALIRRQLALYGEDLVICCGADVAGALGRIYGSQAFHWGKTMRGIAYTPFPGGSLLIAAPHPASRINPCILHYAIVDAVRELAAPGVGSNRIHTGQE